MRVKCINSDSLRAIEVGKFYNVLEETEKFYRLDVKGLGDFCWYFKSRFEIVGENDSEVNLKDLSIQQVLNVINIGDTYESQDHYVKMNDCGGLIICNKIYDVNQVRVIIQSDEVFNLKRETFGFEDALDLLHDGHIIESSVTGFKFKMESDEYKTFIANIWVTLSDERLTFEMREILGEWYVEGMEKK